MDRKHGSYAGYQQHKRRGEDPCDECRAANAIHAREYRQSNPAAKASHDLRTSARSRALTRLRKAHPDEYRRLYLEELDLDGPANEGNPK